MIKLQHVYNYINQNKIMVTIITMILTDQLVNILETLTDTFIFPFLGIQKLENQIVKLGSVEIPFGEFIIKIINSMIILAFMFVIIQYINI